MKITDFHTAALCLGPKIAGCGKGMFMIMKRLIYMILTLAAALSIGGCSSAITVKELSMIEEAEGPEQETKNLPVVSIDTTGSIG
ncbi:MAG: hypothetical protein K0R46_1938 [Herbinix sp.]|nr:hypothetical protein [Herbinix sp.]